MSSGGRSSDQQLTSTGKQRNAGVNHQLIVKQWMVVADKRVRITFEFCSYGDEWQAQRQKSKAAPR